MIMTNSERAAYIRGLMEGLDLDPNAKETKLFNAVVDLLDDLCLSVEEMEDCLLYTSYLQHCPCMDKPLLQSVQSRSGFFVLRIFLN